MAACGGSSGASIPAGSTDATDPTQPAPSGDTPAPASGGGSGSGQKPGDAPPPPGDHAPSITSVTLTPTTMGPGVTVTIDAVVTDPDGDADIAGGTLYPKGASTGAIATFARAKAAGHFTATADGIAFDAASPLTLAPGETASRDFTVRFVDREGAPAAKDVTLAFDGGAAGICRGASVASFWRDCTSCSVSCPSGTECVGNACASRLDCGFASFSCSSRCMDAGKTCIGSYAVTYVSSDDLSTAMDQCGAAMRTDYGFGPANCAATIAGNAVRGCYCK